jgi:succinate dehydrogenase/fumarate reductase cytochrome b subunit
MQTISLTFGGFIVAIIFLGAMLGGNNIWESIRKGMSFVFWGAVLIILAAVIYHFATNPS